MPRAAVCTAPGGDVQVRELDLAAPRVGELRVRLGAAAVCATDASVQKGTLPAASPIVLGHQGAGIVTALGDDTGTFAVGDHVVLSAMPQCGTCYRCARGQHQLCEPGTQMVATGGQMDGTSRFTDSSGAQVHQMAAMGTFAEETVVPMGSAVRVPHDVPFAAASLIGCAVLTGFGAAVNTASIREGDTVAVLGCGPVGLSAIQGARLAGAGKIVAIDRWSLPGKLDLALAVGATDVVRARDEDPVATVKELTDGRGSDVTIEAIGAQDTINQAIALTSDGGEVILAGAGSKDVWVRVRQFSGLVLTGKSIKGCMFGSACNERDIGRVVDAYRAGQFELDRLVSRVLTLDQFEEALHARGVISAVVAFDPDAR